jgi:hypothetical protein
MVAKQNKKSATGFRQDDGFIILADIVRNPHFRMLLDLVKNPLARAPVTGRFTYRAQALQFECCIS